MNINDIEDNKLYTYVCYGENDLRVGIGSDIKEELAGALDEEYKDHIRSSIRPGCEVLPYGTEITGMLEKHFRDDGIFQNKVKELKEQIIKAIFDTKNWRDAANGRLAFSTEITIAKNCETSPLIRQVIYAWLQEHDYVQVTIEYNRVYATSEHTSEESDTNNIYDLRFVVPSSARRTQ